jgi:hypothetical protein
MWPSIDLAGGREACVDLRSWSLGLSLILLTIAVHTTAVVLMALGLESRFRVKADQQQPAFLRAVLTVIGRIAGVAVLLAALHGFEAVLWASDYRGLGALHSFADASLYSLASMTTFDVPGLAVPSRFRMLGALEAVNGVLLFGISTAFLFAVMQVHWQVLSHRRGRRDDH